MEAYIGEPLLYPSHMLEEVARERRETALRIEFHLICCEACALMNPNGAKKLLSTPDRIDRCDNKSGAIGIAFKSCSARIRCRLGWDKLF
jgi:hypothetical protein